MSQDSKLIETYNNKRDLYATIASSVFHKDYWECMEHWEDGSPNPTGKGIRSKAKGLVLGIMYGMGAKLMASILKVEVDECKEILEEFFKMFPTVKDFTTANEESARKYGYVEDYMGRRRHLPDALLPEIEIHGVKKVPIDESIFFDKLTVDGFIEVPDDELTRQWTTFYEEQVLNSRKFNAKKDFKERAKAANIRVVDNGAFISKTMTQCTNARIQGGASSLTKKAMVRIANDPELHKLGFRLLIPVHDELLGECPVENAELVGELLANAMIEAAKPECSVAMKVDTYVVHHWYSDEVENALNEEYNDLIHGNAKKNIVAVPPEEALAKIKLEHPEFSDETLKAMCEAKFDHLNGQL